MVLGFGCLFALIVAFFEFLWNVRKVAVEEKMTPWEAFKAEILFAMNIWIVTKPVHNTLSESESPKSPHGSLKSHSRNGSESRILHEKSASNHGVEDEKTENGSGKSNGNGNMARSVTNLNKIFNKRELD